VTSLTGATKYFHFSSEPPGEAIALDIKIVAILQVQPEAVGCFEKSRQAQGGIGGNGAFTEDDFVDASRWNTQSLGEAILRKL
jgi:uncharacterized protein (DUF362 family)